MNPLPSSIHLTPGEGHLAGDGQEQSRSESSSSPTGKGAGGNITTDLIRVWDTPEPGIVEQFWGRYVPMCYLTNVFANGGVGKSMVLIGLALSVCLGRPFLGRLIQRGAVLWIDAEGMRDENVRRAYRASRGMDLERVPANFYHFELSGSITEPEQTEKLKSTIDTIRDEIGPTLPLLIILDSFTAACFTADQISASEITAVLKIIAAWGTVVIVDHISKAAATVGKAGNAFGTIFKRNFVRSSLELCCSDEGAYALFHEKHNMTPKEPPLYFGMTFDERSVKFETLSPSDPRISTFTTSEVTARDVVLQFLRTNHPNSYAKAAIVKETGIEESTVANALTKLKKDGKVDQPSRGQWRATTSARERSLPPAHSP